jgi:hypothetical protein
MRRLLILAAALVVPACHSNPGEPDAAVLEADAAIPDAAPPDGPAAPMPDLQPMWDLMDGTWSVESYPNVTPDSPVYVEGCVSGLGTRTVLRFDTVTGNLGDADFYVGVPSEQNPLFQWSPAHGHYHVRDYADYKLIASDLTEITGHKQAFCLLDSTQITPGAVAHYGCENQGISVGYADTYGAYLDCQWIDITGVPSGTYTLQVQINPTHLLPESNYTNNVYQTTVSF